MYKSLKYQNLSIKNTVLSPAAPLFVLLHGLIILFAITYYMGMQWQRTHTISLFVLVFIWGGGSFFIKFRERRPVPNRIDLVMGIFLLAVLISVLIHWWEGSIKQIQQMPFLLVAPYILGRAMCVGDAIKLRGLFVFGGLLMAVLVFPEYLRYVKSGYPYIDSPYPHLFDKNVGSMMSGHLLAFGLLSLVSILVSSSNEFIDQPLKPRKAHLFLYVGISTMIFELVWMGSRGPLLIGIIGMCTLVILSSIPSRMRKMEILLVAALIFAVSFYVAVQRQGSREHYSHLLQSPEFHEIQPEIKTTSPKQVLGGVSILGSSACDNIRDSVSERWIHYEQAIALFLQNPLAGVGANHYGFYACQGPGAFPHNVLLQVFTELGAAVGILYCYLLWMAIKTPFATNWSSQKKSWGLLGSWLVAFSFMQIVFALISGDYFASAHLYFAIGLAASMLDRNSIVQTGKILTLR